MSVFHTFQFLADTHHLEILIWHIFVSIVCVNPLTSLVFVPGNCACDGLIGKSIN